VPVVPAASSAWHDPQLVAKNSGASNSGGSMPGTPATLAT
jgi:hypothetical protein